MFVSVLNEKLRGIVDVNRMASKYLSQNQQFEPVLEANGALYSRSRSFSSFFLLVFNAWWVIFAESRMHPLLAAEALSAFLLAAVTRFSVIRQAREEVRLCKRRVLCACFSLTSTLHHNHRRCYASSLSRIRNLTKSHHKTHNYTLCVAHWCITWNSLSCSCVALLVCQLAMSPMSVKRTPRSHNAPTARCHQTFRSDCRR